jgi:hypothetical protein
MKQAIAGVTPSDAHEVTVMTVWPSNASYGLGRFLGRWYDVKAGFYIFKLGNLIALASIPIALMLYLMKVLPFVGRRYRVTNRRIVVELGISCKKEEKAVDLDRFDSIDIDVQRGQEWYHAGDLIFLLGKTETFRLEGVSRPSAFKQVCLKSRTAYVGVQEALARQSA